MLSLDEYGGPIYTVPTLCEHLARLDNEVFLHALGPAPRESRSSFLLRVYPRSPVLHGLGLSQPMKAALRTAAEGSDFLHSHSLWTMPTIYPAQCIRGTRCRLLLSPRGTLDPWAFHHHSFRKRIVWLAGQKANFLASSCIHATADQEYGFIRELGLKPPVAIIPNGVDIPPLYQSMEETLRFRQLLFLARVHAKKGVDILLRSWRNVQDRFGDWELRIVGPDDRGYLPQMRKLAASLGARRVTFTGWIPEKEKTACLRRAELYVLPTHGENWGVSIADALAHGLPAIVGKGAPWSGLETHQCGWWIDNTVESVTECLKIAMALPAEELKLRGSRGRAWMAREFPWTRAAEMMNGTYRWLLDGGATPAWVALS